MHTINIIKHVRNLTGWSQEVTGAKIGIGQHRVSLIERGLEPSPLEREKIIKALEREGIPLRIPIRGNE